MKTSPDELQMCTWVTQQSNWVTGCWFACKWDTANKVMWLTYTLLPAKLN